MNTAPRLPRPEVTHRSDWRFPLPTVTTLANGLEVWVFHLPGQHVVAMDLLQPINLDQEPAALEGVATLTLRASDEGTHDHPQGRITELLENAGAAYGGRVTHSVTASTLDVPVTRFGTALPLFAEIIQHPALAAEDVERHRGLRLAEIDQTLASGAGTAGWALRRVLWQQGSRSSRPSAGLRDTVSAISAGDVADFHRQHWGPQGSTLIVAGDFPADPMPSIEAAFGQWRHGAADRVQPQVLFTDTPPSGRRVHLVHRPDAVQIDLRLAGVAVDRTDPRWAPLQVATVAVGGSFLSRLNKVIREERGYTYGIHLSASPLRHLGTWTVNASIRTEVAAAALDETLRLLDVADQPLTEAETADALTQLVGIAPLRYDTAEAVVGQASVLAAAGMDADQVNRHHAALAQVTPESATQAYTSLVGPDRGHIIIVGNADELTAPLTSAGYEISHLDM